ncbi:MAG: hypothetical protein UZ01_02531 [Candidatus Brocadia sinica]|nr:MAG: hypothetical protein UZ01_02531 [Candidatus Brocadia sinica]MCK6468636.1 hypothetical protein [Candidatus Brocadia sinica]NUO06926.1 hypothetical protein [Candidatus Brocadia sinica]
MFGETVDIERIDEINARVGCLKELLILLSNQLDTGSLRGVDWLLIDAVKKVEDIYGLVNNKELAARGQIARIS